MTQPQRFKLSYPLTSLSLNDRNATAPTQYSLFALLTTNHQQEQEQNQNINLGDYLEHTTIINSLYILSTEEMVFVYTGKGRRQAQKDDAPPEQRKCAKQACAIQWCLAKRDHKEHLCQNFIDDWQDCCEKARAAAALEASSPAAAADSKMTGGNGAK